MCTSALVVFSTASAQTFTRSASWHLAPQDGTYTQNGVGSPTVVFRKKYNDYVMFFESRIADPDPDCTVGTWGISYATSPDGLTWTQATTQQLPNDDGTYYECVAAHPYAVVAANGEDIHLWFKGEQGTQACDAGPKPWGCNQYTGVGYAKFDKDLSLVGASDAPVLAETEKFGYPAVTMVDGTWYMVLARFPSFYIATSTSPDSGWSVANGGAPVMVPGVTTWSEDELFNPSLTCDEGSDYPFKVFFGGRNFGAGWPLIDLGGWGDGISQGGVGWFVNAAPYFNWSGNDAWRHWDTIKVGDEYITWFSEKNGDKNHIGFAHTTSAESWSSSLVETRICPQPDGWSTTLPGTDFIDKSSALRDLIQFTADDPATGQCAADMLNNEVQDAVDGIFTGYLKGQLNQLANEINNVWAQLDKVGNDCGYDVTVLQQNLALLAMDGLKHQVDRAAAMMDPTTGDLVDAQQALDDALLEFGNGDFDKVLDHAEDGYDGLKQTTWDDNYCPADDLQEAYLASLCGYQSLQDDLDAQYAASGDNKLRDARNRIQDGLEGLATVDIWHAVNKFEQAMDKLDQAGGMEAEMAELASMTSELVRQFVDDGFTSGHEASNVAAADALWNAGETARLAGDYVQAMNDYRDAANNAKP